jgi:hypothetical protein
MSRDASGNYTLPAGNPVATGTTITVAWANPTMADVGAELTNSLDRGGRGAMTAPLKLAAGSAAAPAITFNLGTSSGLYRAAALDLRFSVGGVDTFRWIDDTGAAAGEQQPAEVWDGAAWRGVVYTGGPNALPVGTLDDTTIRWDAATSRYVEATFFKIIDTGLSLTVVNGEIIADDTDGSLTVGAGQQGVAYGGNVKFYGDAHATQAGDFEIRSGTTVAFRYDASADTNLFIRSADFSTAANIASAATIDLDAMVGNRAHVTGNTQIDAVTLTNGPRTLIFDGVLTLAYHATTNKLPSGANIITAAGDIAVYESDGATVYCSVYTRADGTPVINASSNGGANVETISADETLTAESDKLQKLTPNVFGLDVVAPDATLITTGINVFKIYNAASVLSLGFTDGAGNVLGFIPAESNTTFDLSNNATAAGVWEASTTLDVVTENTDAVISPAGGPIGKMNRAWICYLSATRAIIVYCAPSTAYPTAVAVDLDTYELGTPFTISTNTNNSLGLAITNLTSTTAFVVYEDKKSVVLTLTDMTISAGTPNTTIGTYAFFLGAASGGADIFFKLNSSQIITIGGWGGDITVFNITITSGDTININSATTAVVSGDGYWGGDASLSKISDTSFLMSWQSSTGNGTPHYDMSTVVTCAASSNPTFGTTGISVNIIERYVAPTCTYSATKFLQILNTSSTTFTASVITVSGTGVSRGSHLIFRTDGQQGYTEQYLFRRRSAVDISTEMGDTTLARGASLYHCGGDYYITIVKPDTFDVLLADFTTNTVTVDSTFTCTAGAGIRAMVTENNILLLLSYSGTTLTIERYQLDDSGATAMADVVITGVPANPTGYSSGDVRIALYTASYMTLLDQNGELVGKGTVDPTIETNADDWPINKNGWMINLVNGSSREIRTLRTI